MEKQTPSKTKSALNFGAVLGFALMILSLLTYVFELYENQWFGSLTWVVLIIGIIMGVKKYRDENLGGYISYGQALGYGVLLTFFASIIVAFINFIYLGYVDDGFITYSLEKSETEMYEAGTPDEAIEQAMGFTRKIMSPGVLSIIGIFMTTFIGFIISLIAAAFLKKEADPFEESN